jgi:hypothetical protein
MLCRCERMALVLPMTGRLFSLEHLFREVPGAPVLRLDKCVSPSQVLHNRLHELLVSGQGSLHKVALGLPLACFVEDRPPLGMLARLLDLPLRRAGRVAERTATSADGQHPRQRQAQDTGNLLKSKLLEHDGVYAVMQRPLHG